MRGAALGDDRRHRRVVCRDRRSWPCHSVSRDGTHGGADPTGLPAVDSNDEATGPCRWVLAAGRGATLRARHHDEEREVAVHDDRRWFECPLLGRTGSSSGSPFRWPGPPGRVASIGRGTDAQERHREWEAESPEDRREGQAVSLRQVSQAEPEAGEDARPLVLPEVPRRAGGGPGSIGPRPRPPFLRVSPHLGDPARTLHVDPMTLPVPDDSAAPGLGRSLRRLRFGRRLARLVRPEDDRPVLVAAEQGGPVVDLVHVLGRETPALGLRPPTHVDVPLVPCAGVGESPALIGLNPVSFTQ